jgi:signal transduction histidine kinase
VRAGFSRELYATLERVFALVIPKEVARVEDALRRGRVLVGMCVGMLVFNLVLLLVTLASDGSGLMVSVLVMGGACYLFILLLLRRSRTTHVAAGLMLLQIVVALDIVAMGLGQVKVIMMWSAVVPVIGMFLLGRVGGLVVTLACLGNSVGMWWVQAMGYLPHPSRPVLGSAVADDIGLTTGLVSVAGMAAWLYESGRQRDVEARDRAKAEMVRAMEAAQAASQAKSQFLANMSHEIRTPMNGVLGMLGMLIDTPLNETQRDYAITAQKSARSLLDIINDILDLSRVEAGRMELEHVRFDLRTLVKDVADQAMVQARGKPIEILVHYLPDVPSRFVGDDGRIRQILVNLVSNAVKFTSRGHILLKARTSATTAPWISTSRSRTRAWASRPRRSRSSSRSSSRQTAPPRATTAARAWGSRSAASW